MFSQCSKLHFIVFPLLAPGHIIPLIEFGKLLAQRGIVVTIVSTPVNVVRFRDMISRATESGLDMRVKELQLGYEEAGLPQGCENFDMLPTPALGLNMFTAINNLQPQLEEWLLGEAISPKPSCIISDSLVNCTVDVARKLGIPRIIHHGVGCLSQVCMRNIHVSKEIMASESDPSKDLELRVVSVLNDRFEFTKPQLSAFVNCYSENPENTFCRSHQAEKETYGIILNTFQEFEADYIKEYSKLKKTNKVYVIGPVSLCNNKDGHLLDMAQRGTTASIEYQNKCLEWLDSREPDSVIFAGLGSLRSLEPSQMMELALGLENSHKPFILVMRKNDEIKKLIIRNGFAERVKGRGLLLWGWAPQLSIILSHLSTGAFLTHCGWNSTLKGVTAGVPLVTWPLYADQFINEKLVVQVLGIGVAVAPEVSAFRKVSKEDVEIAINNVMDKGEEGEKRRQKVRKLGKIAKRSLDHGGASHVNITILIKDVVQYVATHSIKVLET